MPVSCCPLLQVVWSSDNGHNVRIPVSVTFRSVLAPAVIDPVPTQPDFTFHYGIRTAGPATVNIRITGLHTAQVVTVAVPAREIFAQYDFTLASPVDYFAAGLFVGDNEALADMYLYNPDTYEVFAWPPRVGHSSDQLLEAHDLPAGNYNLWILLDQQAHQDLDLLLHLWELRYDTQGVNSVMSVSPAGKVSVGPEGVGEVTLSFNNIAIPEPAAKQWPPTRCVARVTVCTVWDAFNARSTYTLFALRKSLPGMLSSFFPCHMTLLL
jgi:hypothetical protein